MTSEKIREIFKIFRHTYRNINWEGLSILQMEKVLNGELVAVKKPGTTNQFLLIPNSL